MQSRDFGTYRLGCRTALVGYGALDGHVEIIENLSQRRLRCGIIDRLAVGVVGRTAHEAYLQTYFPKTRLRSYENATALRSALKRNEVEVAFGDGVSFALWINGTDAAGCCSFRGGPFTESSYFGEGVGIAVRKDNIVLRRALDYALKRISERGVYADLYLKYFPVGFY